MSLVLNKSFIKSWTRYTRLGDVIRRKNAATVVEAIKAWHVGDEADLTPTQHGETRVEGVQKFDLAGAHRLVTHVAHGPRILLQIGTHEEVERWLDRHKGARFHVDVDSKQIELLRDLGLEPVDVVALADDDEYVTYQSGPILDRFDGKLLDRLGIPPVSLEAIRAVVMFDNWTEASTQLVLGSVKIPSPDVRHALINAMDTLVRGGMRSQREAEAILRQAAGDFEDAALDLDGFAAALASGANGEDYISTSLLDLEQIEHLLDPANFSDWMLFLHPDQRQFVDRNYSGPARLLGVSGSGKTCVLLHRARRLAAETGEPVLVLTLSESLAALLEHLLDRLCEPTSRGLIEVKTVTEYCRKVVNTIDPDRLINDFDPRSGENLADCWRDFTDKEEHWGPMESVAWALESRKRPVDPRAYLHDELIWLRSGFDRSGRLEYDVCERSGRGIPFPQYIAGATTPGELKAGMPAETRSLVRNLLAGYEEYMEFGGLMDRDGISLLAYGLRDRIRSKPSLQFRSVLVDEVQDLSTLELAVIAEIATEQENGLYMVGDSVQKVFPKHHSLKDAGLSVTGRAARLNRNYRNTRQILEAAHALIDDFVGDSNIDSAEVIPPEFAVRDGSTPHAYECRDRLQQAQMAATLVSMGTDAWDATCIASDDETSLEEVARLLDGLGIPTQRVSRTEPRREGTLSLAHLDDVKGFEFHTMIVLDVSDPHFKATPDRRETYCGFPSRSVAWEERWRDAFRIYVAMSRAREELHLLYIRNPSILLGCMSEIDDDGESVSRLVEFGSADEWDGEIAEVMGRLSPKSEPPLTGESGRDQSGGDPGEALGGAEDAAGSARKKAKRGKRAKAQSERQAGGLGTSRRKGWRPKQGFGMGWTDANGDTYM